MLNKEQQINNNMLLQWTDYWELDANECPCDVHFLDWIEKKKLENQKIFHMGTGAHHIVGFILSQSKQNHLINAITASPSEYKKGMELLLDNPILGQLYKPIFGDIYQTDPRQYSSLDIVTLFHLCEISNEVTSHSYGLSYEETARLFVSFLSMNGFLIGYKNSFKFDQANEIFLKLENEGMIKHVEDHLSLRIWIKSSS